jgi:hypothetical protein
MKTKSKKNKQYQKHMKSDLRKHRLVSTCNITAFIPPPQLFIYVLILSNEAIVLASFGSDFYTCTASYLKDFLPYVVVRGLGTSAGSTYLKL